MRGAVSEPSAPGLCSHWPNSDSSFSSKVQVHLHESSNLGFTGFLPVPSHNAAQALRESAARTQPFRGASATTAQLPTHRSLLFHPPCGDQLPRVCLPTKPPQPRWL